jgi:hypothetical protein
MIRLVIEDAALSQARHVPSLPAMSALELARSAASLACSHAPRFSIRLEIMMQIFGIFVPAAREKIEVGYQYNHRLEMDWRHYADTFCDKATNVEVALASTIDWWRQKNGFALRRST